MPDPIPEPRRWADAWQQLVYEHSPFRAADDADFQELLRQLSELEQLFLATDDLAAYYAEWEPSAKSAAGESKPEHTFHAAAIQMQLMEDAFYSLRLDRYANSPDNRGWMNLFRRWSTSPTFVRHAERLAPTLSRQFVAFYLHYIEGWEADLPVPHPWDVTAKHQSFAHTTKRAIAQCSIRKGKGIFLDPGRVEAGSHGGYEPSPVKEGQHGSTTPASSQTPATASGGSGGVEDSSAKTD
jgi:hypothetical protein